MKQAVSYLLDGDIDSFHRTVNVFPPDYAAALCETPGVLSDVGAEEAVAYPLKKPELFYLRNALAMSPALGEPSPILHILKLVDRKGNLTPIGRARAIELLPLENQCEVLGISLQKLRLPTVHAKVELDALEHFQRQGFLGTFDEGSFPATLVGLASLQLWSERLHPNSPLPFSGIDFSWFLATRITSKSDRAKAAKLRAALKSCKRATVLNAVQRFNRIPPGTNDPRMWKSLLVQVASSVDLSAVALIGEMFIEHPFRFRHGWADLSLFKDGRLQFVEVKSSDKLHFNQIMTLPRLKLVIPDISVCQVTRLPAPPKPNPPEIAGITTRSPTTSSWRAIALAIVLALGVVLLIAYVRSLTR